MTKILDIRLEMVQTYFLHITEYSYISLNVHSTVHEMDCFLPDKERLKNCYIGQPLITS
jgi:hypothetical protein